MAKQTTTRFPVIGGLVRVQCVACGGDFYVCRDAREPTHDRPLNFCPFCGIPTEDA